MITQADPIFDKFYNLAQKIGRREYVVRNGKERDYLQVSTVGIPRMNGDPLSAEELYTIDKVRYQGRKHRASPHSDGVIINVFRRHVVLPFCTLEDVHDFTHLTHCLDSGSYPIPESMIGLLNREDVKRIYDES